MLNTVYGGDEPSIFESSLTAQIGGGGVDVTISTGGGNSDTGSGGFQNSAPPVSRGVNLVGLLLIGLLIYIALK